MAPMYGWCPMRVGRDTSSVSLGWSLLPSSVFIVLALVNSDVPHWGTWVSQRDPRVPPCSLTVPLPQDCCAFWLVPMCIVVEATSKWNRVATTTRILHLVRDIWIHVHTLFRNYMDMWKIVHKLFANYTDYLDSICTLFIQYLDGNLPHFHPYLLWSLLLLSLLLLLLQVLESTGMENIYIYQNYIILVA